MTTSVGPLKTLDAALLLCGLLAMLVWIAKDVAAIALSPGYDAVAQSNSALSAADAPTRRFVLPLEMLYALLLIAFGCGVWRLAGASRALHVAAALIILSTALSAVVTAFFPARLAAGASAPYRQVHVALMATGVIAFVVAIGFGAFAFDNWFRYASAGVLLIYLLATILGLLAGREGAAARPVTVGVQERAMLAIYFVWLIMLAVAVWRGHAGPGPGPVGGGP